MRSPIDTRCAALAYAAVVSIALGLGCSRERTPLATSTVSPSNVTNAAAAPKARAADVAIEIGANGVAVNAPAATGVDCAHGAKLADDAALGRCLRAVRGALGNRTSSPDVRIVAEPQVTYQMLVRVFDATRGDAGDLFPYFTFGAPSAAAPVVTPLPTAASADSDDDVGLMVVLTKTQLRVGDDPVPLAQYELTEVAWEGLPAQYKRHGRGDFVIVPLAERAAKFRESDRQVRELKHASSMESLCDVLADANVPYRVLFEVLYTLQQSGVRRYRFITRRAER